MQANLIYVTIYHINYLEVNWRHQVKQKTQFKMINSILVVFLVSKIEELIQQSQIKNDHSQIRPD